MTAWAQNDPEDYVRSSDVEASPDADTPKPCGIKLILSMLDRGGTPVASCLLAITSEIQVIPMRFVFLKQIAFIKMTSFV